MWVIEITQSNWQQQAHDTKNILATVSKIAEELGAAPLERGKTLSQRLERSCSRILEICALPVGTCARQDTVNFLASILEDVVSLAEGIASEGVTVTSRCPEHVEIDEETGAAVF